MNLWKRLCGRGCAHRFNWPRIDASGRHYQICLLCGTAYEYDWTTMRLTNRLLVTGSSAAKAVFPDYPVHSFVKVPATCPAPGDSHGTTRPEVRRSSSQAPPY
jgi:hypothetical protein